MIIEVSVCNNNVCETLITHFFYYTLKLTATIYSAIRYVLNKRGPQLDYLISGHAKYAPIVTCKLTQSKLRISAYEQLTGMFIDSSL